MKTYIKYLFESQRPYFDVCELPIFDEFVVGGDGCGGGFGGGYVCTTVVCGEDTL